MKSIRSIFASMAFIVWVSSAAASEIPRPNLSDVFQSMARSSGGTITLPAAWAGVWNFEDSDYDCITEEFLNSDANVDTLCTGQVINPDESPFQLDCTGSVNDTDIDVHCSGTFPFGPTCMVTMTFSLVAVRNGDNVSATTVFSQDFEPDNCALQPDNCIRTVGVGTRVGPEPPDCLTPVEAATWGRVKAGYR